MANTPWIYSDVSGTGGRLFSDSVEKGRMCIFCNSKLTDLGTVTRKMKYVIRITDAQRELARRAGDPIQDTDSEYAEDSEEEVSILRCPMCGWWAAWSPYLNTGGHIMHEFGYGQLRALNPADIGEPIEAIRAYLASNYESRFNVDPRKFEEVVCSIFKDLGYRSRLTSYSGDGGIDIYLDGANDSLIGVQVKRWGSAIKVEQINALTGALVTNDCTAGVFVTTSRYQKGAILTAKKATAKGFPIQLYDSKRLFEALQIAQAKVEIHPDDPNAPWMICNFPSYFKVQ